MLVCVLASRIVSVWGSLRHGMSSTLPSLDMCVQRLLDCCGSSGRRLPCNARHCRACCAVLRPPPTTPFETHHLRETSPFSPLCDRWGSPYSYAPWSLNSVRTAPDQSMALRWRSTHPYSFFFFFFAPVPGPEWEGWGPGHPSHLPSQATVSQRMQTLQPFFPQC
jgi:hypothetical protein